MKLNIPEPFSGAARFVELHGDALWEFICDEIPCRVPFKVSNVTPRAAKYFRWTERQTARNINTVLRIVEAQGNGVATRTGHSWII